ncbi:MAG TPA: DAK2 domain-containing protein [Candidatus Baltobacteraceae bacterium]|nr:DAK2 domain-containing protein [Candidatus Baltobacteraceae bacterium]
MPPPRACDGEGLLAAFEEAAGHLQAHVDEINALNVFPVPDGDTGSNMAATVRAALDEAHRLPVAERTLPAVADALSFGALMGARGNSGVILSQIFRGMSATVAGRPRFDGSDFARALASGTETAYAAVVRPVEGTILTVVREAAVGAGEAAAHGPDTARILRAATSSAESAVAGTPALLPILKQAGVVDAGGQGLYRLLEGALTATHRRRRRRGRRARPAQPDAMPAAAARVARPLGEAASDAFGYETMFLVEARDGAGLDLRLMRRHLEEIGGSVLVAGDERTVKVHVHNEQPDQVLALGLRWGHLSRITVENLDDQARGLDEQREIRAEAFAGLPPAPPIAPDAPVAVVVVATGEGLAQAFRSLGAQAIVHGGQGANPSTAELVRAIRDVPSRQVVVLPNNPNTRLAAEQAAALMADRHVAVVPTRNAAEGLAALMACDTGRDALANAGPMLDAARAIQTLQVTRAIRDARLGRRRVRSGQLIALGPDDGIVAAGDDLTTVVLQAVGALRPGFELVTIYYGADAQGAAVEAVAEAVRAAHDRVEVEVLSGGQPFYDILLAAE